MAPYRKHPLPLGHKAAGQQRARTRVRATVPDPSSDWSGFRGRRRYLASVQARTAQYQPTSPVQGSRGTFNTEGRPSF